MNWLRSSWFVCRWLGACLGSFALWSLWVVLVGLLVLQSIIAVKQELRVPTRVVRSFEHKLALSGARISFDSASFDSTGRVLVENLRLFSSPFTEPIATCQSAIIRLDRLALTLGRIQAESVVVSGGTLFVPSMLSATGQTDAVAADITAVVDLEESVLAVRQFTARAGNLQVSASGLIDLTARPDGPASAQGAALKRGIASYLRTARPLSLWVSRLDTFSHPSLSLVFQPDEEALARVRATFFAVEADFSSELLKLPGGVERLRLDEVRAYSEFNLRQAGDRPVSVTASVGRISASKSGQLEELRLHLTGTVSRKPPYLTVAELHATAGTVLSHGVYVQDLVTRSDLGGWPTIKTEASLWFANDTWSLRVAALPGEGQAEIAVSGRIFHPFLRIAGEKAGRDLNELLIPAQPASVDLNARLSRGWKLDEAAGELRVGEVVARTVSLDAAQARFHFNGEDLAVTDILLAQGEQLVRGSYTVNAKTLDFRFLLAGDVRPARITGWFHDWWPRLWENFDFAAGAPRADVDVRGRWRDPLSASVYVGVDARGPIVREVSFDRVRTTLFIRPDFYDSLELIADRSEGQARGRFTRVHARDQPDFRWMNFEVKSNLNLHESARLFGKPGLEIVEPFAFEVPPLLTLKGEMDGPASPDGTHERIDIDVQSQGAFAFFGFPLSDLTCTARVRDDTIELPAIRVGFAQGMTEGSATLAGEGENRQLALKANLKGAKLGDAIRILEEFGAQRSGAKPSPQSRFQQRIATGTLDLQASATGMYNDPHSYVGDGHAEIRGAEFAQINLLGALSQALRGNSVLGFTSWSLDTATTRFSIEKQRLVFPDVQITGPSAKLEAHGYYAMDQQAMNFSSKFYPFEQGKTLLASAVDLVLTPVSAVLELKLSGALDNPKWYFSYGPTGLLRKLAGTSNQASPVAASQTESKPGPPLMLRRNQPVKEN